MSARKVTDITITRLFEVCCDEHGVVDAQRKYSDAIMARRDHFFDFHKIAAASSTPTGGDET